MIARKPAVFFAQHVFGGHAHIVEMQRRGIGCPPPHLPVERRAREAGSIRLNEEQRDAFQALVARARADDVVARLHAAGDEGLGTIDDPVIAVAPRRRLQVRNIGSAGRLGDGEARAHAARDDIRKHAILDLIAGEALDQADGNRAAADRRADAACAALRKFLREGRAHETVVEAEPAILLGHAEAPRAERADFLVQLPRHLARFIPFRCVRRNFRSDEATDGFAERTALLCLERVSHHHSLAHVCRAVKLTHRI